MIAESPTSTQRPKLSPAEVRDLLQQAVLGDLLGPANGPDEVVDEGTVRDRYLLGRLGPQGQKWTPGASPFNPDDLDPDIDVAGSSDDEESMPDTPTQAASMQPSAMGMSFVVEGEATALRITARWGRYVREDGKGEQYTTEKGTQRRVWRRVPMEGVNPAFPLREGRLPAWSPDPLFPDVRVEAKVRRRDDCWHVTLFLVNGQSEPTTKKMGKDSSWLFQPELMVKEAEGRPLFARRPLREASDDPEVRGMNMRYRNYLEFAVGHGVSVRPTLPPGERRKAIALHTEVSPVYDLPPTQPSVPEGLETDMRVLQSIPDGQFSALLSPLITAYEAWIDGLALRLAQPSPELATYRDDGENTLTNCRKTSERIQQGIALLDANPQAAAAFRFANRAMADQRVRSIYAATVRQELGADLEAIEANPNNHAWRTFQLAFILLNLPSLTDPLDAERGKLADLLWFPTGGGKTEAYLGVAAYTLAIRRLQGTVGGRSGHGGVAVLMRYTLRLLTLQQFQRATTLICACELIRREDPVRWGHEPFRIGLWVGGSSTPNRTEDAAEAVRALRDKGFYAGSTPHQLTNCPWCGAKIDSGRHIEIETRQQGRGRTWVFCGDDYGQCAFSKAQSPDEGLPILTVDEEIYARLPALLIATVDKFAQMPWNGRIAMLFGQVDGYCERHGYRSPEIEDTDSHPAKGRLPRAATRPMGPLRPPDLIIQDELHLISGPLGTMVGLYETAVDRLATWELAGVAVRPKVIASTATVRRAARQVDSIFARQVNIFPAQGLDAEDNFFAQQIAVDEQNPGRRYLGIYAPGVRHRAALIRVYTAFLSAARYLYEVYGVGEDEGSKQDGSKEKNDDQGEGTPTGLGLDADPWMTLVGYFNSLRELGSMKRAVDDSVNIRLRRMDRAKRPGLASRTLGPYSVQELTSRRNATEIPAILDQLEASFNPALLSPTGGRKVGRAKTASSGKSPLDVLLATNMISVGVDVSRLGLMVVAGQPKNTAEYIQATSRVGRRFPGLVCTVYNWTRPRDISHYERFIHYHATFYQHVEALSVTPFAPRALDRGLSGAMVALVRLLGMEFNANQGASRITRDHSYIQAALAQIIERAGGLMGSAGEQLVRQALASRLDQWLSRITRMSGAQLGYKDARDGQTVGLLSFPERGGWSTFTCLNSLRDVEPTVNLILNEYGMDREDERAWPTATTAPRGTTVPPDDEPADDEEEQE